MNHTPAWVVYTSIVNTALAAVYRCTYTPFTNLTLFRIKKNFNYTNHYATTFSTLPILPPGLGGKETVTGGATVHSPISMYDKA